MKPTPKELIEKNRCGEFHLCSIDRDVIIEDGLCVGIFYRSVIAEGDKPKRTGVGLTPEQSVERALEKVQLEDIPIGQSPSDTPETDAFIHTEACGATSWNAREFMRKLERERDAARKQKFRDVEMETRRPCRDGIGLYGQVVSKTFGQAQMRISGIGEPQVVRVGKMILVPCEDDRRKAELNRQWETGKL